MYQPAHHQTVHHSTAHQQLAHHQQQAHQQPGQLQANHQPAYSHPHPQTYQSSTLPQAHQVPHPQAYQPVHPQAYQQAHPQAYQPAHPQAYQPAHPQALQAAQPQTQQPGQQPNFQPGYQHGYQPVYQQPRQNRLDYNAIPSVPDIIRRDLEVYEASDRRLVIKAPAALPPLVTTLESNKLNLTLEDGGCARPGYMRSTIYQVPVTKEILENSGLEFAVVIKPFGYEETQGTSLPLNEDQIIRCTRCNAFENPFSLGGSCCICGFAFQSRPDQDSRRPQAYYGSYEFRNLGPEYYRDKVAAFRRPHIIFAIETTVHSRHLVEYLSKNLAQVIKSHFPTDFMYPGYKLSPLVGFATYDSKITIYDVANGGHAYVVSDVIALDDCAPTPKFLVDPNENFEAIENFLSKLSDLCNDQMEQQTILGPVVEAVLKTCLHDTSNYSDKQHSRITPAGKLYILQSTLPTAGEEVTPGKLSVRRNIDDMKKQLGSETESKVLAPEGKYYRQLAQKCVNDYATGVELYLFPPNPRAYMNVATISDLACLTGTGVVNKYNVPSLNNFIQDLKFSLQSTMGFDASMRVRTSTGISPIRYIGNLHHVHGSNLEMSAVNANSNFIVQMKYDDKIPENDFIVVQFAMLYTSVCGERRVRVHNLALTACQDYADLYKMSCCDTLINVISRDAIDKMRLGNLNPRSAKEQMVNRIIHLLTTYKKYCSDTVSNSAQLILPEGLKLLPVYLCGALKCDAIDGGMEMFPDDKVIAQIKLLGATPSQSQVTFYPRVFSIEACSDDDESNEFGLTAKLTRCLRIIIDEQKGACYILENGYYLFIFFPNSENSNYYLANIFGPRADDPDLSWEYRQRDSMATKFLELVIDNIVKERRQSMNAISVIRQGKDKLESVFNSFLYEDEKRPNFGPVHSKLDNASYETILLHLHHEIKVKLAQQ